MDAGCSVSLAMSDITRWTNSDVTKPTTTKGDVRKNSKGELGKARIEVSKPKSDVSKASRSDASKTKGVVSKPAKSDVTAGGLAQRDVTGEGPVAPRDVTGGGPAWRLSLVARRVAAPGLRIKPRLAASPWSLLLEKSGLLGPAGGADRLAKTVNALRAAVRFRGQAELEGRLAALHRLDPAPESCFNAERVHKVVNAILHASLEGFRYDGTRAAATVMSLSQHITDEVKLFEFPRYKLITQVIMGQGQVQGQNLQISSRCLWNSYSDKYACATYETPTYFVVALVHATYFE